MVWRFKNHSGLILEVAKQISKIIIFDPKKSVMGIFFWTQREPQALTIRQNILQDAFRRPTPPDLVNDDQNLPEIKLEGKKSVHP